MFVDLILQIIL